MSHLIGIYWSDDVVLTTWSRTTHIDALSVRDGMRNIPLLVVVVEAMRWKNVIDKEGNIDKRANRLPYLGEGTDI